MTQVTLAPQFAQTAQTAQVPARPALASPAALDLVRPVPQDAKPDGPELRPLDRLKASSALGSATPSLALDAPNPKQTNAAKPVAKPSPFGPYNPVLGKKLAAAGIRVANSMRSENWCFRGVKRALGIAYGRTPVQGGHAYQAEAQLARNPRFKKIAVAANGLRKLPAGAIVVWRASKGNPDGHISIALGDGRESSDHIQRQMTRNHGARFSVFVPVK